VIENMVELVGIEPTTSSLRILNPVRDDATPKKSNDIIRKYGSPHAEKSKIVHGPQYEFMARLSESQSHWIMRQSCISGQPAWTAIMV
jgi:hypothetical protein